MSADFILGPHALSQTKKSLKALNSHQKVDENSSSSPIYLTINIKIKLIKQKDYKSRIIPLTYKVDKVENKSILLITKDPSNVYREALIQKDSPTEDSFNEIISLKKLKSLSKNSKNLIKLYKENDLIVCDFRIFKFLPDILGSIFYLKNKKIPFMIQMNKPNPNIQLPKSRQGKIKDNQCDPRYVQLQLESIIGNTSFIPTSNSGDVINLKIGYTNWSLEKLIRNINDIISYLIDEKFKPLGGILNLEQLGNIHVKCNDSISLPVLITNDENGNLDESNDNDSDFDF
ncbi:uncharacterized protein KGF55_000527 [Candida pseudojiufengensis]|uniref:uncharacterized protein n=1 Tax=Candida pseudojiufengensis TaxID=497109 RepID=UPI002224FA03|nr:uncharacterized protein KGF55_000527 [Candida pseudojiufengensis]KAI5966218.1 hypothetical protein KGF55_000527 [Candida pseudojiufengensis]